MKKIYSSNSLIIREATTTNNMKSTYMDNNENKSPDERFDFLARKYSDHWASMIKGIAIMNEEELNEFNTEAKKRYGESYNIMQTQPPEHMTTGHYDPNKLLNKKRVKTVAELSSEIAELVNETANLNRKDFPENTDAFEKAVAKNKKKIREWRKLLMYLESGPKVEHITDRIRDLKKTMEGLEGGFQKRLDEMKGSNIDRKKLMAAFKKEHGFAKMQSQIQTMKFLLK